MWLPRILIRSYRLCLWSFLFATWISADIHIYQTPDSSAFSAFLDRADHRSRYDEFVNFLSFEKVADVLPPHQLLRQGSGWKDVNMPPFAMPPDSLWSNIVPTLRLIRDHIIPMVGTVEAVSAFRTPEYNAAAGGDPQSKHMAFRALDLVPVKAIDREILVEKLKTLWETEGNHLQMGLGLYWYIRFHIHTGEHEIWGE